MIHTICFLSASEGRETIPEGETSPTSQKGGSEVPETPKSAASPTSATAGTPVGARRRTDKPTNKLTLTIGHGQEGGEGAPASPGGTRNSGLVNPFAALGLGTPKFHRKQFDAPQTPIISQTPKHSWFTNLFNFKPDVFELISDLPLEKSNAKITAILTALTIKFQVRKDGLIKCKFQPSESDEPPSPVSPVDESDGFVVGEPPAETEDPANDIKKSVKFKIEFVADRLENTDVIKIQFTHQQGKIIY